MYLFIPVIEVIFCLALLVVLMVSGKRHVARRPFTLFLVFMAAWGFFIFMMRASTKMSTALLWEYFVFGSILSASLFFYRFAIALTGIRPNKLFVYPMHIAYFVVMVLIPTGLVVSGMQMMWYGKAPVIGPLFFLYVLCAYVPIVRSAMIMIKQYRRTRVIDERIRYQYITVGIGIMLIGATTDFFPAVGINMYPLGIIGNIVFCVAATLAMLKHNLMEMKVVLRKVTTYSLTSALIFGIFGTIIYLLSYFFRDFFSPVSLTITILAVFIAAVVFQPILTRFQHTVDRWFFKERYAHIQTLKNFTGEIRGDLDLEQLGSSLVAAVANSMQARGVYLLLPSPTTGNYTVNQYSGQKSQGRLHFPASSPFVAALRQQNTVVDSNDMDIIPSLVSLSSYDRQPLQDNDIELVVPLRNNGHLAGILLLSHKTTHQPYTNEERRLLQTVSTGVAGSIDSANRYENIKRKHSDLQKAIDGIIHAISLVVETRDPYTAGHQRRVAELAKAIAVKMGLSEWQVMGVYITGLLHDVGKVAVPSEILSKPGKINQNEFSIIKNHCRIGHDILQRIEFPWPVTQAILQHHERLNGSGYPDGLSGEEIILEAKILGVADVVEAMSSHRPYRPALGLDSALEEIALGRGILYDPEVVEACLRLLAKNEPEFDRIMAAADSNKVLATVMNT
jgi:HD-GYP domain-containing protein (c-di-GMP phosphodiesterase class II)